MVPKYAHYVAYARPPGRVHRAVPSNYPLTDRLQFDILQSGPGWRGPDAIGSIETARVDHASRRRSKGMEKTMRRFTLLLLVALLGGADRLAAQETVETRG